MAGVIGSKKLGFTDYQLTSAKMRTKREKSLSEIEAGWLVERLLAEFTGMAISERFAKSRPAPPQVVGGQAKHFVLVVLIAIFIGLLVQSSARRRHGFQFVQRPSVVCETN